MIEYVKGQIEELTPTQVVIETGGGIGYGLFITLNTYSAVQGKDKAKLFVYESIREDAYQLFGFATKKEREVFTLLIGVPGVGGQTARMVLSAFTPADLARIVETGDVRSLKSVKGIGPKAAQRILLDLKDKTELFDTTTSGAAGKSSTPAVSAVVDEAVQALGVLGFPPAAANKAVRQIVEEQPTIPLEAIIKAALKML